MHNEDRLLAVVHEAMGDAAQEHAAHQRPAAAADDDKIDALFLRLLREDLAAGPLSIRVSTWTPSERASAQREAPTTSAAAIELTVILFGKWRPRESVNGESAPNMAE
jgi:hypothetical protein